MSTASTIKPVPTLKGIFNPPKMKHRRDFLRENKLSLRELQRVTTNKQVQQTHELQQKQQRQTEHHQQQNQHYVSRRSASQQRPFATPTPALTGAPPPPVSRSMSQQRKSISNSSRCSSCGCSVHGHEQSVTNKSFGRLQPGANRDNLMPMLSKTESYHKGIQTEDIHDTTFLYNALKKCTSDHSLATIYQRKEPLCHSDSNVPDTPPLDDHQQQEYDHSPHNTQQNDYIDRQSFYEDDQKSQLRLDIGTQYPQNGVPYQQHASHQTNDNQLIAGSARSHATHMSNAHSQMAHTPLPDTSRTHETYLTNGHGHALVDAELNGNMANLTIEPTHTNVEQPLSGRSRHTLYSTQSQESVLSKKRSTGSIHKLGSRDDVRLPRYLEREKREKKEQLARELERDPNCPEGHYVLPEQERQAALSAADKKYKTLVQELNRMPMTTETLRIRTRKSEIERELTVLESDIRIFSKPKVYVKQNEQ